MATIFEPVSLGALTLPNRLLRSATWEGMAASDGAVMPGLLRLYQDLTEGGVGLIISSYLTVHPQGRQHADQIGAHDDAHVEGLTRLARAVHDRGGLIAGQLVHCGGQSTRAAMGGLDPLAPSAVPSPGYPEVPRALSVEQIHEIAAAFGLAAARLRTAGFDAVQLHGAHGFLLSQFLSPLRNQRADRYGGDLEGRCRFALEVLAEVRRQVGPDFPVLIKLNLNDFLDGSTTEADAIPLAQALVAGGLAAIEVSGGTPGSGTLGAARAKVESPGGEAYFLPQARALRAALPRTPLILVGGLRSLGVMERILAEGSADAFALSRPLIREPDLPRRWREGDRAPARCISCLGCFGPARRGEGVRCVERFPDA